VISSINKNKNCLGASGTGRTTFVNTLCESEVLQHKVSDNPETAHVEEGIRIKPANVGACMTLRASFFIWLLTLFLA
jgi:septin family protein